MSLDRETRRALRFLQSCLDTTVPTPMLEGLSLNDVAAWSSLAMLEMRVSLARGQTYYARQFAQILSTAADAGLAVDSYERQDVQRLINAIDAVQAGRHYLAMQQLTSVATCSQRVIRWAAQIWRARGLAATGELAAAGEAATLACELAAESESDARAFAVCVDAEIQALDGQAEMAERRVATILSELTEQGEVRVSSFAQLSLAHITKAAADRSRATAELAYQTDVGWTGPVIWLARSALGVGEIDRAKDLLVGVANPTSDVYALLQALSLIERHNIPLDAVTRDLALADAPPTEGVVSELNQLLTTYPLFTPARATLAWKLLLMGRSDEARRQLKAMILTSADSQAIAALRFGLQTYEQNQADLVAAEQSESIAQAADEQSSQDAPEAASPVNRSTRPTAKVFVTQPAAATPTPSDDTIGFVGEISLLSVPDLVQFFCSSRKSGVVVFSSQRGDAKIRLHEGALHWAVPPTHPNLGAVLHDKQVISQDEFESLAESQANDPGLLMAKADPARVRAVLRDALHVTLKEVVEWSDGWFMFDAMHDEGVPRAELLFNGQGVLLDVLRELDEEKSSIG